MCKKITKRRKSDKFCKYYENEVLTIHMDYQNQGCYNQGITVSHFKMESMKDLRFMVEDKPNFF